MYKLKCPECKKKKIVM